MKNAINPKLLFYGLLFFSILLAMVLDSCRRGPEIVVEVPAEAIGPDTLNFMIVGKPNDNTVILRNIETGDTMLMEVENAFDPVAYEIGLIITLIK